MEAKIKKSSKSQSSVAGIILFFLASAFMLYTIVPNIGTFWDKNIAIGKIALSSSNSLTVSYINEFDGNNYFLYRKIDDKMAKYLITNNKTFKIVYSKAFPDRAYLCDIERDNSIFSILIILVIATTAFFIVKENILN